MQEDKLKTLHSYLEQQNSLNRPNDGYEHGRWMGYKCIVFYFSKLKTKLDYINFIFKLKWMKQVYEEKDTPFADGHSRAYVDILRRLNG